AALLLLLFATTVFAGGQKEAVVTEEVDAAVKVGFIFTGPIADGGWTQEHNRGRLAIEEELGIETLYKESVPNTEESKKVMRDMIDQGCNMIFATSFGYMDYMLEVAAENPDVAFFHSGGYKDAPNAVNYLGKMYQARYLTGIVAGMKTESGKVGYIAAFPIPEVVRGINAFTLGVRSVNPEATVELIWTFNWNDPPREKEASIALIDNGCDVIAQHQTGPANLQAAESRGVWGIGYHADMNAAAPEATLTSAYWNWGPYYVREVKSFMEGTWKAENFWQGYNMDIVRIAPLGKNAPKEAAAIVADIEAKLKDGSFKVFTGPIKNNQGELIVKAGEAPGDGELLGMAWLV
ncbi:MAG: BMP family ABC transporter substrate-binding protein, partial [Spirochaetales bacterium]|nr:BMP family ABC transporter substrate-binding protein [Spirochaetales bacterium]